jgi:orotidine-5'-phosphate decarboxylase
MHAADRLTARTKATSPVCVGLDPILGKLPTEFPRTLDGMREFCMGIIDSVHDLVVAVKPQLAYFELHGWEGMKLFEEVCAYAQSRQLFVIADGKRNDIGSTCEAYAQAYLGVGKSIDALTVTPYLGSDGLKPFIDTAVQNEKMVFVLVKTSNASSGELQDLPIGDEVVHEHMAQLVEGLAAQHIGPQTSLSCVGAVVGATYPEEMKYLRTLMPHVPFLIPGYGAQGGTAADAARGFVPDGTGAVVNASRSILYASEGVDWKQAARKATEDMVSDLKLALQI